MVSLLFFSKFGKILNRYFKILILIIRFKWRGSCRKAEAVSKLFILFFFFSITLEVNRNLGWVIVINSSEWDRFAKGDG